MTALHGQCEIGTGFEIISDNSPDRACTVSVVRFEANKVDMALLRLVEGEPPFEHWLGMMTRPPEYQEEVSVLSLQPGLAGGMGFSSQSSKIFMFDPTTALCRAQYFASDGLSGSGVITGVQPNGSVLVVGVHVASHDDTDEPPAIKKKKGGVADADSVSRSSDSSASSIHGHSSYCIICIASLVPEIMDTISRDV